MPKRPLFIVCITAITFFTISGCQTVESLVYPGYTGAPKIYSGTRFWVPSAFETIFRGETIKEGPWCVNFMAFLDTPFCIVLDTCLLPITLPWEVFSNPLTVLVERTRSEESWVRSKALSELAGFYSKPCEELMPMILEGLRERKDVETLRGYATLLFRVQRLPKEAIPVLIELVKCADSLVQHSGRAAWHNLNGKDLEIRAMLRSLMTDSDTMMIRELARDTLSVMESGDSDH